MKHVWLMVAALGLILCGCRRSEPIKYVPQETVRETSQETTAATEPIETTRFREPVSEEAQLLCLTESREEAEEIAALYGIVLTEWYDGMASYRTEEDPQEVVQRGLEQGWPELSVNYERKLY